MKRIAIIMICLSILQSPGSRTWGQVGSRTSSPATIALVQLLEKFGMDASSLSQDRAKAVGVAIAKFGRDGVPALRTLLASNNTVLVRQHVYTTLAAISESVQDIMAAESLSQAFGANEDKSVRALAVDFAATAKYTPTVLITAVAGRYNDPAEDAGVRGKALIFLCKMIDSLQDSAAIKAVRNGVLDPAPEIRVAAIRASAKMTTTQPEIAFVVAGCLEDAEKSVRDAAISFFSSKKSAAAPALEPLMSILADSKNDGVVGQAAFAIEYIGSAGKSAESILIAIVGDSNRSDETRYHAATALGAIQSPLIP